MPPLPGFIGGAYLARSPNVAADRLVNLYPEVVDGAKGKHVAALYGTPGLRRTHELSGSGAVRGLYTTTDGRVFGVRGGSLYELFAGGTSVSRGTLLTTTGPVSMADNGTQLAIADGTRGYVLTLASNSFAQITDADFPGTSRFVFLDGYFCFPIPDTGQFGITGLYDGTSVDALDFATAEGSPDLTVTVLADHRELWVFGTRTIEVFFNSGDPDFPFDRIQGAFIEYGCGAAESVAALDNTIYWLGSGERGQHLVFRATGYQPQRISTHAIEHAISTYTEASRAGARAYTYQSEGHSFYVLGFDEATWAYDVSTGLWAERARLKSDGTLGRHRAACYTAGLGMNLVGDFENGNVYELDPDTFTDSGTAIPRIRTAPHVSQDLNYLFHHALTLDLETGVGDGTGQSPGDDPQIMLTFSDDGGHTFSSERWVSAGKIGNFRHRAIWRRLGRSRDRVYEVRYTAPTKVVFINAKLDATAGRS